MPKPCDLSQEVTQWLEITYPAKSTETPVPTRMDMSGLIMQFQVRCPSAFRISSVSVPDKDGFPQALVGLAASFKAFKDGTLPPIDVPDIRTVFLVSRELLKVPEWCGENVVDKAIGAFVDSINEITEAKKDTVPSPGSSEPTPVSPA